MYRERPKSPSFTHSGEATRMFRTAMSLEGGKDQGEVVHNTSEGQTDGQRGRGEDSLRAPASEGESSSFCGSALPGPTTCLAGTWLRQEPWLVFPAAHTLWLPPCISLLSPVSHHSFSRISTSKSVLCSPYLPQSLHVLSPLLGMLGGSPTTFLITINLSLFCDPTAAHSSLSGGTGRARTP